MPDEEPPAREPALTAREQRELEKQKQVRVGTSSARGYWLAGVFLSLLLLLLIAGAVVGWAWALAGIGILLACALLAFGGRHWVATRIVETLTQLPFTGHASVRAHKEADRRAAADALADAGDAGEDNAARRGELRSAGD